MLRTPNKIRYLPEMDKSPKKGRSTRAGKKALWRKFGSGIQPVPVSNRPYRCIMINN